MAKVHLNSCNLSDNRSFWGMVDLPQTPTDTPPPLSATKMDVNLQVDPKLLTKALKKMQGLVNGNGLSPDKVSLLDSPEDTAIKMFRFKARTTLKLVPQYGIKIESGRNTVAELMPSESEFKRSLANIAIDARTSPQKRQQIIDIIFGRSDKGFGIKEQRIKLQSLNRDFVQHQKCLPCANTGRTQCPQCHGKKTGLCPRCQGRRYMKCPRCRGTTKIQTGNGQISCQFCRGDGRISCTVCAAQGQVKCQVCAAAGTLACKPCAATGWLSHLAHIEVYAQVVFDFDKESLPVLLASSIEKNPSRCIEKHEIEVAIKKHLPSGQVLFDKDGQPINPSAVDIEPDDTIWIDYEAISPFGPISFQLDTEKVSGQLFGFQARLLEFPHFMDKLTQSNQDALIKASQASKDRRSFLEEAVKSRFVKDVIAQILILKNVPKSKFFLGEKYSTGVDKSKLNTLIDAADLTLRRITRIWRSVGMFMGLILFSLILEYYYLGGGRLSLKLLGLPELAVIPIDILLIPSGVIMGVFSSKLIAKWSQNKALHGIVDAEILKAMLPKAGKTLMWSIALTMIIILATLVLIVMGGYPLPSWLEFITTRLALTGL